MSQRSVQSRLTRAIVSLTLLAALVALQLRAPLALAFTSPTVDGRLDEVYSQYGTVYRYIDTQTHTPTGQADVAAASLYVLEDANYMYVFFRQDLYSENDNSYGANLIHWEVVPSGQRTFAGIWSGDYGTFLFEDAGGNTVAHFRADQLHTTTGTPSGYGCLGFSGGDGSWLGGPGGNQSYVVVTSAMDYNLNQTGYCSGGVCTCGSSGVNLLLDSPAASGTYQVTDAGCDQWLWHSGWEIQVDKRAFGTLGFGGVTVAPYNSPVKMCWPPTQCQANLVLATSSIGDRAWYDSDGDGLQDAGEPGLQGVKVNLIDPRDGRLIESQVTGADGAYLFKMLSNDYYIVQVDEGTLPAGFLPTNVDTGGDYKSTYLNTVCGADCIQRDGLTYTRPYYINLNHNQAYGAADFGYRPAGAAIGDYVWSDANNNGLQDAGEPGIGSVLVELLDGGGNPLGPTATTNAAGWYLFSGLSAGAYRVRVAASNFNPAGPLAGYSLTTGTQSSPSPTARLNLKAGDQYLNADFGYYQAGLGSIGDYVWFDSDNDGVQDATEAGAGNVSLDLYVDSDGDGEIDAGEPVIAQALTDAAGSYGFSGLTLGQHYLVKVSDRNGVLTGMDITTYDSGLNRYNDPYPVYLDSASPTDTNADFGYNPAGSIGDSVWFDADQDGVRDAGEAGVGGVTVSLERYRPQGNQWILVGTTTTAPDGGYLFTGQPADRYRVTIAIPAGYSLSTGTPNNPHELTLSGNLGYLDVDFGLYRASGVYSIGDIVWHDANADGLQGTGESGIAGVTLALFDDTDGDGVQDPAEPLLGTAVTGAAGNYSFSGAPDGNYLVVVTDEGGILAGYRQTAGLDPYPLTVNGANRADIDLGYVRNPLTGGIGDKVWYDIDGAGDQDVTESGIGNVVLDLYRDTNNNGVWEWASDQLVTSTLTGLDGAYSFSDLAAGTYFVHANGDNFDPGASLDGMASTTGGDTSAAIDLAEGQVYGEADLGYRGSAYAVGDYLWSDADQDGVQDPGEPGLDGVLLELLDGSGNPTGRTTSTRADGLYLLSGLAAGSYRLRVAASNFNSGGALDGYAVTSGPQSEGANTSRTVTFVNDGDPANDSVNNVDWGYYKSGLGSIGNLVWFDLDADGYRDTGEAGLSNVTIDLVWDLDGDGAYDLGEPGIASVTTDGSGGYQFVGLKLDDGDGDFDYLVRLSDRNGVLAGMDKTAGTPDTDDYSQAEPYAVALAPAPGVTGVPHADFGYYRAPGSVGDRIWHDVDHDGIQDSGESGIQGVWIDLYRDVDGDGQIDAGVDNLLKTAATDAYGGYLFTGLATGSYIVKVVDSNFGAGQMLQGLSATLRDQGGDDALDSDGDLSLHTAAVTLDAMTPDNSTIDLGFYASTGYAIGDLVWEDIDRDGHKDGAEIGLDNVSLVLYRDLDGDRSLDSTDFVIGRDATDSGGAYSFANLPNGQYIVRVTDESNVLVGYTWTDGIDDTDDESQVNPYPLTVDNGGVSYADFGFSNSGGATAVVLSSFRAYQDGGRVVVEWQTASEVGTLGFYLGRLDEASGQFVQLNAELLPGLLSSPQGGVYRYVDSSALPGGTYTYQLVEVEVKDKRHVYGPFTVTVDGEGLDLSELGSKDTYSAKAHGRSAEQQARVEAAKASREEAKALKKERKGESIKIVVSQDGLYYLGAAEIAPMLGMNVQQAKSMIKTGNLALSSQGQAVAYLPADGGAGLYFYGQGVDSLYTNENVYWLKRGQGLRMAQVTAKGPVPAGGQESFTAAVHLEKDNWALTGLFTDPQADYWAWDYVYAAYSGLDSKSYTLRADGAVATGMATLTAHLVGATDTKSNPDHHVVVSLNGVAIGEGRWNGTSVYDLVVSFDQALLKDGDNTLKVTGLRDAGVSYSIFYIDSFDLSYRRYYRAVDNALLVRGEGRPVVTIEGYSEPGIWVFDVSDPRQPRFVAAVTVDKVGGAYRVSFAPVSPDGQYLAMARSKAVAPGGVFADVVSGLKQAGNSADYVVIAPLELKEAAGALAAYRQGQGLAAMVVELEDIYDEFNYGLSSPEAIRAFLAYAYTNWQVAPRYVVLAGEGTYDYKGNQGYGDNLLPAVLVGTPHGLFASDNWLADVAGGDGVPEMAVGRLPVVNSVELQAQVAKIAAYESAPAGDWRKQVMMVADNPDGGGDFAADSDKLAAMVPSGYTVVRTYLGRPYTTAQARQRILAGLNQGALFLNYTGHGGMDRFAQEGLLASGDVGILANGERLPVVTALTCVAGRYEVPGYDSLGERLVLKSGGGAVAVWSPTGLSYSDRARMLSASFFRAAFAEDDARLGDSVLAALHEYAAGGRLPYMLAIYSLLGDPALRIK